MGKIRVAIAGVGNCCSALVQGVHYYNNNVGVVGLIHEEVGGYSISDIYIVAAFDIDRRKVGRDLSEAIFSKPNKTPRMISVPVLGVAVQMGPIMDGLGDEGEGLVEPASTPAADVADVGWGDKCPRAPASTAPRASPCSRKHGRKAECRPGRRPFRSETSWQTSAHCSIYCGASA